MERHFYEDLHQAFTAASGDSTLVLQLDDALIDMTSRYDTMCSSWQVKEQEFVTKREANLLARLAEAEKRLDERNEATKVWIQAERQTRTYCHQLERRLGIG